MNWSMINLSDQRPDRMGLKTFLMFEYPLMDEPRRALSRIPLNLFKYPQMAAPGLPLRPSYEFLLHTCRSNCRRSALITWSLGSSSKGVINT